MIDLFRIIGIVIVFCAIRHFKDPDYKNKGKIKVVLDAVIISELTLVLETVIQFVFHLAN